MEITVTKDKKLGEISDDFHKAYPYLKIEFFKEVHGEGTGSHKSSELDAELQIGAVGKVEKKEDFYINGNMKVSTFESQFQEHFGVGVQVFRMSGHSWIITTATDDWTLSHQNKVGHDDHIVPNI